MGSLSYQALNDISSIAVALAVIVSRGKYIMNSILLRPPSRHSLNKPSLYAGSRALTSQSRPKRAFVPSPAAHVRHFRHDSTPDLKPTTVKPTDFAFAFDIDGVLLRSSKALPGAAASLQFLHRNSIPFILLTNGGGRHESSRVKMLSNMFAVPIAEENFVQSHTPFKMMVDELKDKTILVTGNDQERVRDIALRYGFSRVVTPGDIWAAQPNIWPFSHLLKEYYTEHARSLPEGEVKIDAMFVFSDPHDWALDTQLFLDLLLSENGVVGTYSQKNGVTSLPNRGWYQDNQPKLIFSNPDLFWASSYPQSRLGQGGFRAALQGVWDEVTDGAKLPKLVIGKPTRTTYLYAEKALNAYRHKMFSGTSPLGEQPVPQLKKVYMVGDNPESDIRGANDFESPQGTQWESLLVKTGVWRENGRAPKYRPKEIVQDVREAVKHGLRKEGYVYDEKEFIE